MPVSKKRKKKRQKSGPPPSNKTATSKPRFTMQKILLYVISGVMILSLAASFIVGSVGPQAVPHTPNDTQIETEDGNNLLDESAQPEDTVDNEATTEESAETTEDESVDDAESSEAVETEEAEEEEAPAEEESEESDEGN